MNVAQKVSGKAMSIPGGLALGAGVSMLLTVALSAAVAKLVQTELLSQEKIGYGVMIILLISSFLGAMTAQGRVKHRRAMVCFLSGILYYLLLLSITALFFGGQYSGMWVTGLVILAGVGSAAMTTARQGRGGRNKKFPKALKKYDRRTVN